MNNRPQYYNYNNNATLADQHYPYYSGNSGQVSSSRGSLRPEGFSFFHGGGLPVYSGGRGSGSRSSGFVSGSNGGGMDDRGFRSITDEKGSTTSGRDGPMMDNFGREKNSNAMDQYKVPEQSESTERNAMADDGSGSPSTGLKRIFLRFADKTSVVGAQFIKESKNNFARTIWTILLLAAIGAMIFHLASLFATFFKYEKFSKIALGFANLPFPAVTVCNINPVRMSMKDEASENINYIIEQAAPSELYESVEWDPEFEYDYYDYDEDVNEDQTDLDFDSDSATTRKKRQASPNNSKDKKDAQIPPGQRKRNGTSSAKNKVKVRTSNFLNDFKLEFNISKARADVDLDSLGVDEAEDSWEGESAQSSYDELHDMFSGWYNAESVETRKRIGHQITDMLLHCSFNGKKCVTRNFTRSLSSKYGNCYTIDYKKFFARQSGPNAGMQLTFNLETDEYIPGITSSKGLHVVIHEQGTIAFPDDEGIAIQAGTETLIGLRQVSINRIGFPYMPDCSSSKDFEKKYGVKYTRQTCQKACLQILIRDNCSCFDEYHQELNNVLKNPLKLPPCRDVTQMACLLRVEWKFQESSANCACKSPCEETLYESTISTRQWPNAGFANLLRKSMCTQQNYSNCETLLTKADSDLEREFVKLNIYYEDLNYEIITEKEEYELIQFISDVGGTIGLWIGLSILGVFEILHLIVAVCRYICAGRRKQK